MPDIHKRGILAVPARERFPHNQKYTCPLCQTSFSLNVQDSRDGYYKVRTEMENVGDQRDPNAMAPVTSITFPCPDCGKHTFKARAPWPWSLEYAQSWGENEEPDYLVGKR